jgi:hypothetical protein
VLEHAWQSCFKKTLSFSWMCYATVISLTLC